LARQGNDEGDLEKTTKKSQDTKDRKDGRPGRIHISLGKADIEETLGGF
jgi:hypothetical protein